MALQVSSVTVEQAEEGRVGASKKKPMNVGLFPEEPFSGKGRLILWTSLIGWW